jgi:hypothetical protein
MIFDSETSNVFVMHNHVSVAAAEGHSTGWTALRD